MTRQRLIDVRMHDGSRHFGGLPEHAGTEPAEWHVLEAAVPALAGAKLTSFVTDHVTEAWIDFEWRDQRFAINNQLGEWWFFVHDPTCPDELLEAVLAHFEGALCPRSAQARSLGALAHGSFRVVVDEADGRTSFKDFATLEQAVSYAGDAASESDVHAFVFDGGFRLVARGKHY
ncbi:MAG: hypothetical protein IT377_22300 [Polyangiaceae bacterium]|nr:hypothetical protein [Myxococcales bacterium]MCC6901719.1 hypothetical protein [Polyangiaceae bacterium]